MTNLHRALNWILAAVCIALWMLMASQFDAQLQKEQEDSRRFAELTAEARFAQAAQAMCGPNAAWERQLGNTIQCTTKRGHKTINVAINEAGQ